LAFVLIKNNFKNYTPAVIVSALVYAFVGSYLWFSQLSLALSSVFYILLGLLASQKIFTKDNWPARIVAVIVYDNIASIPIFYGAFQQGGIQKLWLQIISGIPFTAKHLISFTVIYLCWQLVYNFSIILQSKKARG
jgi:hypothetical protein